MNSNCDMARLLFVGALTGALANAVVCADDFAQYPLTPKLSVMPVVAVKTGAESMTNPQISFGLIAGSVYPSQFCPAPKFGTDLEIPRLTHLQTPGVAPFSGAAASRPSQFLVAQLDQTDNFLDRLADLEKLEILPILRTTSTSVYFGVNRDGMVGMHLNSRNPDNN